MRRLVSLAVVAALAAAPVAAGEITFRHALDDSPLDVATGPDAELPEAVNTFHETGENPYVGDEEAVAAGEKLYKKYCQACHMPDGTGRIGPNLVDDQWKYERAGTDVGRFEVVYGGAAGAMQAFSKRMSQDEILKVLAFVDSLPGE